MATTDPVNNAHSPANGATTPAPAASIAIAQSPRAPAPMAPASDEGAISAFASQANFEAAQRMAKALSSSSLMPKDYQGNIPNCLIAMEMASRIGASVLMVAQALDIIHGRPSWRSTFLIATVNASKRFTPLRFRFEGKPGTDEWGCRAVAKCKEDNEPCIGALITIALAKAEGWTSKNGSKWKTMPEQMLIYRAAAFWTRVYAPELSMGIHTAEEVIDTTGYVVEETPAFRSPPGSTKELEAELLGTKPAVQAVWSQEGSDLVNQATGEAVPVPAREPGEEG